MDLSPEANNLNEESETSGGILDTVSFSHQNAALRAFNPLGAVLELLETLKPRGKQILIERHGLGKEPGQTLETIGKRLNLTRERVRQIEKDALKKLNSIPPSVNFKSATELLFQIIESRGNIAPESKILEITLGNNSTEVAKRGVQFILKVVPTFNLFKESQLHNESWYITGFDKEFLDLIIGHTERNLRDLKEPQPREILFAHIRKTAPVPEIRSLPDEALESYLNVSKIININPFGHIGLVEWPEICPKDVGDKAYLVLLHHDKPEHYSKITEMINQQNFDRRVAHKETVHNELIKDDRFVLIGRGIYALKKWGYKEGIVADIIREILQEAGRPLSRDEIIDEVLKQRMVKKNTVVVGLLNRRLFKKTSDSKYTIITEG